MSSAKPTIVIVPGAWHTPAHFKYLTRILQGAGYEVVAVTNASVGVREAALENGMEADAAALREALDAVLAQGKAVVLVMHSYAGIPGSEAVGTLPPERAHNIVRLMYIATFICDVGQTVSAVSEASDHGAISKLVDGHLLYHTAPVPIFYQDVSRERADEAVTLLQPIQISAFMSPAKHPGWKETGIPITYVACKQDNAISFAWQQRMIEKLQTGTSEVDVAVLDCGHSPYLIEEEKLAWLIRQAAGEKM